MNDNYKMADRNETSATFEGSYWFVPLEEEPADMTDEQREHWLKDQAEKGADKLAKMLGYTAEGGQQSAARHSCRALAKLLLSLEHSCGEATSNG